MLKLMTEDQLKKHVQENMGASVAKLLHASLHGANHELKVTADHKLSARNLLDKQLTFKKSTRSKFRQAVDAVVGPQPETKDEWKLPHLWKAMLTEGGALVGQIG